MGKLDSTRMSNATKVNRVDNVHNQTESDVAEILGAPDGTQITSPIFGTAPGGGKSVQPDGSIRGCPVFKMAAATSDPASAIGFEFKDGTATKRLVMTDSGLKIWDYNAVDGWTQVANIESPGSGAGTFLALSDVDDDSYSGKAGYLVVVNTGGTGLELVAPTAGTGITTIQAATDFGPGTLDSGDVGKILYVQDANTIGLTDAPSGAGAPFVMWLEAAATTSGWGRNSWIDVYNWAFSTVPDDGGYLTDSSALLTNDGLSANKFITLDAGVYEISVWYTTSTANKTGTRSWKVVQAAGSIATVSPACYGVEQIGNFYFSSSTAAGSLTGIQQLGTRQLIVLTDSSKIKLQVKQTSTNVLQGVTFFATITKVK